MKLAYLIDPSVSSKRRKIEIHNLLASKKYKEYFYRVSGVGKIPPNFFQKLWAKLKTVWHILAGNFDQQAAYGFYCDEVMHKTHMKSLLEKQIKLKCLGIVPESTNSNVMTAEEKFTLTQKFEEHKIYDSEMSDYLDDQPEFHKINDRECQRKLDMMKLYIDSNGIDEKSIDAERYIQLVSIMRQREED